MKPQFNVGDVVFNTFYNEQTGEVITRKFKITEILLNEKEIRYKAIFHSLINEKEICFTVILTEINSLATNIGDSLNQFLKTFKKPKNNIMDEFPLVCLHHVIEN